MNALVQLELHVGTDHYDIDNEKSCEDSEADMKVDDMPVEMVVGSTNQHFSQK